jgi:hypothetical protein
MRRMHATVLPFPGSDLPNLAANVLLNVGPRAAALAA